LATGKLCLALGSHLLPRVDELLSVIRDSILLSGSKRSKGGNEVTYETLRCVSDMVKGLGVPFHDRILSLLEPMLQSGLTAELVETIRVVAEYIPSQKEAVQLRLLDEATKILGGDAQLRISEPDYLYSWTKQGQRYGLMSKVRSCGVVDASINNSSVHNSAAPLRPSSPVLRSAQQVPVQVRISLSLFHFLVE